MNVPVRRSRGRMSAEEDEDEEPPVRRRKSRSRDDDDDEDFDERPRRRSRGRPQRRSSGGAVGSGWILTAAIVNVVYALLTFSCSGCALYGSSGIVTAVNIRQQNDLKEISNDPRFAGQEKLIAAKQNAQLNAASEIATAFIVFAAGVMVASLLMAGSAMGFFMKKKFGTYMAITTIGLVVLWNLGGLLSTYLLGAKPEAFFIVKLCGGLFFYYGTYIVLTGLGIMKGGHTLN